MREYEEEKEVIRVKRSVSHYVCDRCKCRMGLGNVEGWYTITIDNEWNDGYDYYGDKETLEICPECFPLVQSAMVAAGVKI